MFEFKWSRLLAVAERDLRRFRRNTTLMIPMALMPIIYLVILGKAMGGDLHGLRVALVDEDHGPAAVVVHDRMITLQQSRNLFRVEDEASPSRAVARLRQGAYKAVVIVPEQFSASAARGERARLGVIVDNTDNTSASVIESVLRSAFAPSLPGAAAAGVVLSSGPRIEVQRVDVYGHKEFMQYLVAGVIALALFFVAMLAGGIILVDDRARGIHEGYFVTPLSALDLVGGLTLSALTLSAIIGSTVLFSSILIARIPLIGGLQTLDVWHNTSQLVRVPRSESCPVCAKREFKHLESNPSGAALKSIGLPFVNRLKLATVVPCSVKASVWVVAS